ncbi:MAG TPA: hypothetical protein VL326_30130 [Kofleriaceae bacterium]|jgi:hypothetical protein|nr:hypothetical protein [Kofleriaceae bacterium]
MKRLALLVLIAACHNGSKLDSGDQASLEPAKDALTKTSENGPVKATIRVWPAKPNLGDSIYLRLDIDAPAGISVDAPFQEAGDQRLGRFKVVGFVKDSNRKPDGAQHQEQTYTLEAPASGKHRIPPMRLEMVDSRGEAGSNGSNAAAQEILTEEIPLDVAPVPTDAIGKELHAAAGKLDPDVGGTPWLWIGLGVSIFAVALSGSLLTWRYFNVRRSLAEKKSAYEDAIAKLQSLEARGAPTTEQADAWFVELSSVVRDYVEGRYGLRAPELTTEEFLFIAARWPAMSAVDRTQLTSFLERCDRVKFAGYRPESQESLELLTLARKFVEDTRPRDEAPATVDAHGAPKAAA